MLQIDPQEETNKQTNKKIPLKKKSLLIGV